MYENGTLSWRLPLSCEGVCLLRWIAFLCLCACADDEDRTEKVHAQACMVLASSALHHVCFGQQISPRLEMLWAHSFLPQSFVAGGFCDLVVWSRAPLNALAFTCGQAAVSPKIAHATPQPPVCAPRRASFKALSPASLPCPPWLPWRAAVLMQARCCRDVPSTVWAACLVDRAVHSRWAAGASCTGSCLRLLCLHSRDTAMCMWLHVSAALWTHCALYQTHHVYHLWRCFPCAHSCASRQHEGILVCNRAVRRWEACRESQGEGICRSKLMSTWGWHAWACARSIDTTQALVSTALLCPTCQSMEGALAFYRCLNSIQRRWASPCMGHLFWDLHCASLPPN